MDVLLSLVSEGGEDARSPLAAAAGVRGRKGRWGLTHETGRAYLAGAGCRVQGWGVSDMEL